MLEDWGQASVVFDDIKKVVGEKNLVDVNEAQTRFDVIDRIIKEVLGWSSGLIKVEEKSDQGYVDYILRNSDYTIVVEAKKLGASFPSPTKNVRLKLTGSVLGTGEINRAINQARKYAEEKKAQVVIVTNGQCWCAFPLNEPREDVFATVFFPFSSPDDPQKLFDMFAVQKVEAGSLDGLIERIEIVQNRLIKVLKNTDSRIDRNQIAQHIAPALDIALRSESILSDDEILEKCFVITENRTRFDNQLGTYFAETKPIQLQTAKRIKRGKSKGYLEDIIKTSTPSFTPLVTLVIGQVGVGKSTYLHHFQKISGKEILKDRQAHWIYLDFEEMGKVSNPRSFIYDTLRVYLNDNVEWNSAIQPAYAEEFKALARGPYALTFQQDKIKYQEKMQELVANDYEKVEPYVDKVFRHLTKDELVILVLDNVDLYEDEELETKVFAEGLALSKRIKCNVIVSIRDTTFVKHQSDSTFNAYELNKLWLDPPQFKNVLTKRLSYSKKILENRPGTFTLNNLQIKVSDLQHFFDIVQQSILSDESGIFIEAMADSDIRRGLNLVSSFLMSGHVEAENAVLSYLKDSQTYHIPFHEVFKGTMLGYWKHYQEDKANCLNLFDSRLGSESLLLLRLVLLREIAYRAKQEDRVNVPVKELITIFNNFGASENHTISCIKQLIGKSLLRSTTATEINSDSVVTISRCGSYYSNVLIYKFSYVEECMYDTAIDHTEIWSRLEILTSEIDQSASNKVKRMKSRKERIELFLEYLKIKEEKLLSSISNPSHLYSIENIRVNVLREVNRAVAKTQKYQT